MASIYLKTLKTKALKHTQYIDENFETETKNCIQRTKIYGGEDGAQPIQPTRGKCEGDITLERLDSVQSLIRHHKEKTAVLNFASYKNPGGKFFDGSIAQEESLCHNSNLYNILRAFPDYYAWNKRHNNHALYTNRALYTEDVVFFDESVCVYGADPVQIKADVITCAAPNFYSASKYAKVDPEDNETELEKRIKFVLDIAEDNNVDTLILGAFGCGVFGQDAMTVAKYFKKYLKGYNYHFNNVYFSIKDRGNHGNYSLFKLIFDSCPI